MINYKFYDFSNTPLTPRDDDLSSEEHALVINAFLIIALDI